MKYSTKLSDAVHILAFIVLNPNGSLTSDSIAESVHTNPGCVRQLMSSLRRAGLISSVKGHPKPSLTKELSMITLLDIYRAVEGEKPLLHLDTHTNPECGVGIYIQLSLQDFFDQIQEKAEEEMKSITLHREKARSVEGGAMEQQELYRYYSTQRPVDIGTYPKDPDNPLTGFLNYDERTSVEHGAFRAWGEVIYRSPLTPDQIYQYELRPSRDNPDVRRTMAEQAQVVGIWEMRNHVPENRRMTRYVHPGKFIAGKRVTPEELARQCRLAQDYPFVYTRGPRPKKSPQIEGR